MNLSPIAATCDPASAAGQWSTHCSTDGCCNQVKPGEGYADCDGEPFAAYRCVKCGEKLAKELA